MSIVKKLIRKNILNLTPYSSARDEFSGQDAIFLDANENPFETGLNRYPDPLQLKLKNKIAQIKNVDYEKIFLGNGSDEPIDLLIRAFCEPGIDNILGMKPTYNMYKVCADINNVEFRESLLTKNYQLHKENLLGLADGNSKIMFLCTPNNPTSNSLYREDIVYLLENFNGLVVVDEAYIDFTENRSLLEVLDNYPNLVVLQTLSKAWGMAGIRLGMAFASRGIINVLNHIKYPYNINILTQRMALERLDKAGDKDDWVRNIKEQREVLRLKLSQLGLVKEILPSDANFLMVRFEKPLIIFKYLIDKKIIVRNRSKVAMCEGCLRFTIGTKGENQELLAALRTYKEE
jgi:histidinol-phosphate aminotransferase